MIPLRSRTRFKARRANPTVGFNSRGKSRDKRGSIVLSIATGKGATNQRKRAATVLLPRGRSDWRSLASVFTAANRAKEVSPSSTYTTPVPTSSRVHKREQEREINYPSNLRRPTDRSILVLTSGVSSSVSSSAWDRREANASPTTGSRLAIDQITVPDPSAVSRARGDERASARSIVPRGKTDPR